MMDNVSNRRSYRKSAIDMLLKQEGAGEHVRALFIRTLSTLTCASCKDKCFVLVGITSPEGTIEKRHFKWA